MILAAGLSPAWQQIADFDQLRPGEVNRATQVHWCASGKVLNAAIAVHRLGAPCRGLSVAGGPAGHSLRADMQAEGVAMDWVETTAPSRVCTTIRETGPGRTTELVENAPALTQSDLETFLKVFEQAAATADVLVLSGSLPAGTPADFYRTMLQRAGKPAVLDIRGDELIHALECCPRVVKPNREELAATVDHPVDDEEGLRQAVRALQERGAEWVVITDGAGPVYAASPDEAWRFEPARPRELVNPIGCGDSLAAGLAVGISEGRGLVDAVRLGMGAAAANLENLLPARLEPGRAEALAAAVQASPLAW
ncbi:Tagatose-6-phosphate kinase [Maioricimonas rarisocia]|uniref:Tagatose-6-phosphate kinase n=1 Tax=Maioricimonas rarisocia TaxID=2528026 RepID=A0A517Z4E9_9PLAN|nr:1-phosphofructokinase family hexose kinase [Maioricimonas rarisocia]QDU37297.1 Tagatose-6-phosphate kinase [Maioricimonas rarisocia]